MRTSEGLQTSEATTMRTSEGLQTSEATTMRTSEESQTSEVTHLATSEEQQHLRLQPLEPLRDNRTSEATTMRNLIGRATDI